MSARVLLNLLTSWGKEIKCEACRGLTRKEVTGKATSQQSQMSHDMRFPTMWYVRPAKAQTSLRILVHSLVRAFASRLNILLL